MANIKVATGDETFKCDGSGDEVKAVFVLTVPGTTGPSEINLGLGFLRKAAQILQAVEAAQNGQIPVAPRPPVMRQPAPRQVLTEPAPLPDVASYLADEAAGSIEDTVDYDDDDSGDDDGSSDGLPPQRGSPRRRPAGRGGALVDHPLANRFGKVLAEIAAENEGTISGTDLKGALMDLGVTRRSPKQALALVAQKAGIPPQHFESTWSMIIAQQSMDAQSEGGRGSRDAHA